MKVMKSKHYTLSLLYYKALVPVFCFYFDVVHTCFRTISLIFLKL